MVRAAGYYFLYVLFLWSLPRAGVGQRNTISGTITDAQTGKTLPGANIFFDHTTIGIQSSKNGRFVLRSIPAGTYILVVSFVGYKSFTKQISFPKWNGNKLNISLMQASFKLKETIVKGDNRAWRKNLRKFKKSFLGYTKNAKETTILNPEVLAFKNKNHKFIAFASEPLQIINNALGYKITLYLKKFVLTGNTILTNSHSKFTPLHSRRQNKKGRWSKERRRAYNGSYRHFINALISGSLRDEGFVISFTNSDRYTKKKITAQTTTNLRWPNRLFHYTTLGRISLKFYKDYQFLRVDFLKELPERRIVRRARYDKRYHQLSFIKLPLGKALIDIRSAGEIAPYRAILYGYWGWTSRIPDLLPKNYKPGNR